MIMKLSWPKFAIVHIKLRAHGVPWGDWLHCSGLKFAVFQVAGVKGGWGMGKGVGV